METQKRDTTDDKKRIKKALTVIIIALVAVALIALAGKIIAGILSADPDGSQDELDGQDNGISFFEPDYSENILEDEVYLALNRRVMFSDGSLEIALDPESAKSTGPAAVMFYDYFQCIINGDYGLYPSFFTSDYLNDKNADVPAKFTMQKVYDIGIALYSATSRGVSGERTEIYEVRYSIFENNGTFRRDIKSMETRTLVFEVYIAEGEAKINAIAFRGDK